MRFGQVIHRTYQFWQALTASPNPSDFELAQAVLNPAQLALFCRLQPSEQAHSLQVFKQLQARMGGDPEAGCSDLLVAALLHDVGKICYPLRLWERVWIVLGQAFFRGPARRWGVAQNLPEPVGLSIRSWPWWQRPFVVAAQHPEWGADLAAEAGTSALAVALIRKHQNLLGPKIVTIEDRLLRKLQAVDGNS